jgi:rare lipoprotein A (peptidoglycan hydrolase)
MQKIIIRGLLSLGIFLGVIISSSYSNVNNYLLIQVESSSQQAVSDTATTTTTVGAIAQPQEVIEPPQPAYTVTRRYQAVASWYRHGKVTANGERFDPNGLTAAHKSLPFNTMVRFTNPSTDQTVLVRVNDRGPYIRGREFDLSMRSAQILGFQDRGVVQLNVEIIK